ncbi:MAG: hypothetical protein IH587_12360, partial [Anaerolineae bacterium]|nr:hypothetical protein [Anaerolineae bacterium]
MPKASKRPRPSIEKLRALSDEHLVYEFQQLKRTCTLLVSGKYWKLWEDAPEPLKDEYLTIHNSLVEAFLIHARALQDFFFGKAPNDPKAHKDARAFDYFDDVSTWNHVLNKHHLEKGLSSEEKERVGYEAAHLSYRRELPLEKDVWPWLAIYNQFLPVIEAFITNVPPGRLS